VKNIPVRFHPNPVGSDGAIGVFEEVAQQDQEEEKQQDE